MFGPFIYSNKMYYALFQLQVRCSPQFQFVRPRLSMTWSRRTVGTIGRSDGTSFLLAMKTAYLSCGLLQSPSETNLKFITWTGLFEVTTMRAATSLGLM